MHKLHVCITCVIYSSIEKHDSSPEHFLLYLLCFLKIPTVCKLLGKVSKTHCASRWAGEATTTSSWCPCSVTNPPWGLSVSAKSGWSYFYRSFFNFHARSRDLGQMTGARMVEWLQTSAGRENRRNIIDPVRTVSISYYLSNSLLKSLWHVLL